MKKILVLFMTSVMLIGVFTGCEKRVAEDVATEEVTENVKPANLEGTCSEILEKVYETAKLDADFKESLKYYENMAIPSDDEEMETYIIGTNEVNYTDSVYSAPMMSSVAYQCVLLRLYADEDVEASKQTLLAAADPRKWICVTAESVQVENVGDIVMVIMANEETANTMITAFKALGE